ncbi:MAG: hypothetical protein QOI48_1895 [Solirubrobacteraceae bacterium]|jgi:hypothetical protein|nr:hypothetical protein [Solirubrobacteraceae bacterium]
MRAAVLYELGTLPVYADFKEPLPDDTHDRSPCSRRSCSAPGGWSPRVRHRPTLERLLARGADAIVQLGGGNDAAALKAESGDGYDVVIGQLFGRTISGHSNSFAPRGCLEAADGRTAPQDHAHPPSLTHQCSSSSRTTSAAWARCSSPSWGPS